MRLTPLTPIFDSEKKRGAIDVGNTPPTISDVVPIGRDHQDDTLYISQGIAVVNNVLVVASRQNDRVVILSTGATPAVLGYVEDSTNLAHPITVDKINDSYALIAGGNVTGRITTVDVTTPASPAVEDSATLTGNLPQFTAWSALYGVGSVCSDDANVSFIDAGDPTDISETGTDGWSGYTAYAYGWDPENDILFIAEEEYIESNASVPSSYVDDDVLSAGLAFAMHVNPDLGVLAVFIVSDGGNLVVDTFTYDASGNLTSAGSVTSTDTDSEQFRGCIVVTGTTADVFTGSTSTDNANRFQVDLSNPASPTITALDQIVGLRGPYAAVKHNGIIYVTDGADEI